MPKPFKNLVAKMSPEAQERASARTREMLLGMNLQELRQRCAELTQEEVAKLLDPALAMEPCRPPRYPPCRGAAAVTTPPPSNDDEADESDEAYEARLRVETTAELEAFAALSEDEQRAQLERAGYDEARLEAAIAKKLSEAGLPPLGAFRAYGLTEAPACDRRSAVTSDDVDVGAAPAHDAKTAKTR